MIQRRLASFSAIAILTAWLAPGCGSSSDGNSAGGSNGPGVNGGGNPNNGESGGGFGGGQSDGGGGGGGPTDPNCKAAGVESKLMGVNLVFMFDRSGSMVQSRFGQNLRSVKWEPVVAATESFFADGQSSGMNASLTFFAQKEAFDPRADGLCGIATDPNGNVIYAPDCCRIETYSTPDVALRKLPNGTDFAAVLDAMEPHGATPTRAAMSGAVAQAKAVAADPKHASEATVIVLVTDGMPEDNCSPQSSVGNTAYVAQEAKNAGIKTYVIGVQSSDVDNLGDLNQIANSGGSGQAILVDVDNPENTKRSFGEALAKIRGQAISCSVPIPPPPPGKTFDLKAVNVAIAANGTSRTLTYDGKCANGQGWHYDNTTTPKTIELCPATCNALKATPNAKIDVQFGCATNGQVN